MFPLKINENIFRKTGLIFLFILCLGVLPTYSQYTKNCHYSCAYCGSTYYSHCIICQQPFVLTPIKNANNVKQYYNTLQEQPWGPCMGALTQTNALGIVLVIINILALVYFRNRTVFYLVSTLQTLSLFSFIQIAYTSPISYTLQSLEYFMFATSLNRHNRTIKLQIFDDTRYRMWEFLNSYSFKENFTLVFSLSIVCFVIALVIPVARYFSKSQSSLWSICNCVRLQKIFTYLQLGSLITFFFLIQQSILIISIGLFLDDNFDDDSSNIAMVVIYFIILALMVANICMKNLQMFTNKIGQQLEILKKCLVPVFVVLPIKTIIAVAPFVIVLQILAIIFAKLSSKSYKRSYFHQCIIRREIKYRIIEWIVIVMVIIYYLVETQVQSFQASSAVGVITVVIISIFFFCVVIQAGIELYGKFYLKQAQQLYQKTGFCLSSLRQSKMLQQTIQNFQTTDQGIMDMVFFGRNRGQQQRTGNHHNLNEQRNNNNKPFKKRSNIHLTLDQLNESIENNHNNMDDSHLQRFTPSVSPKHNRQLEKHLKSKTSRTPKNDRTSRFKLNKVSQQQGEQEQRDIQEISMPKASMTREEKNDVQIFTKDEDHSAKGQNQNIAGQKTTQRSFDNVMVKNKNIMREIKTGREMNIQVDDENIQQQQQQQQQQQFAQQKQQIQQAFHQQKSPRFIQHNQQNQPQEQQQQQKINKKIQQTKQSSSKHHIKKPHILNINNSQQQDDLQQLDANDNLRQVDKTIKVSKGKQKNNSMKQKKDVNNINNNNNKKVITSKKQFS